MNCLRRLEMSRWVPDRNVARVGERALRGALQPRRARPPPPPPPPTAALRTSRSASSFVFRVRRQAREARRRFCLEVKDVIVPNQML
jgi:hypothetical protein